MNRPIICDLSLPKALKRLKIKNRLNGRQWLTRWTTQSMMVGISLVLCLLPAVSAAQEAKPSAKGKPKKEIPPGAAAHMSVVALGSVPRRRYKMPGKNDLKDIEDEYNNSEDGDDPETDDGGAKGKRKKPASSPGGGIPLLLPPLAGSVPPSALFYKLPKVPKNGNPWGRMRVGFNNATSISKVHAGVPLDLHYIDRKKNSGYHSYLKLPPLEPWSQVVVFLTPSKEGKTPWKQDPTISILNLRSQALRDKNVLVRNFSNEPVAFVIDDKAPVTLKAGQRKSFAIERKTGLHRVAAIKIKGKVPVLNTSVRAPAGTLSVFAFYNADPQTNGGKNVGAFRTTLGKVPPAELRKIMKDPKP